MESSMESSNNTSGSRLNNRMNDDASSEIDQRITPAERDRISRRLIGATTTPDTSKSDISKSALHSLMSSRKIGVRMGSVNPVSVPQSFRFPNSPVSRPESTPIIDSLHGNDVPTVFIGIWILIGLERRIPWVPDWLSVPSII